MAKGDQKQFVTWAVVVAVVAVAVGVYLWAFKPFGKPQPAAPVQPRPVFAAPGELAAGFPSGLIVDSSAKLSSSYAISYSPVFKQYTATYSSSLSMLELFGDYKLYFQNNGWNITNQVTQYSSSRGLYAQKGGTVASVAIMDRGASREVTVSYVTK